jgi:hypothetical protein
LLNFVDCVRGRDHGPPPLVLRPHPYGRTQHCWLPLQTSWRDFRLAHCSVVKEPPLLRRGWGLLRKLRLTVSFRNCRSRRLFLVARAPRSLMSSESGRSVIIPRPWRRNKPAQPETGTPPSSGRTSGCPHLVKYRTSAVLNQVRWANPFKGGDS